MHTFKKFALVTVLTAGAALPIAAQAANNNPDTPVTTAVSSPEGKTAVMTTGKAEAPKVVASKAEEKPADFASLDKDHSGKLSLNEFIHGTKGSEKKAKQEFASLDKNKDHKLTAEEFGTTTVQ